MRSDRRPVMRCNEQPIQESPYQVFHYRRPGKNNRLTSAIRWMRHADGLRFRAHLTAWHGTDTLALMQFRALKILRFAPIVRQIG